VCVCVSNRNRTCEHLFGLGQPRNDEEGGLNFIGCSRVRHGAVLSERERG